MKEAFSGAMQLAGEVTIPETVEDMRACFDGTVQPITMLYSAGCRAAAAPADIPSSKGIRTNADRVAYLNGCGWQVTEEPLAVEEIRIPEEMDESYRRYLALQAAQGFDLERYAGRRIRRYTYEVTNYPTGESGVQANLMLYRTTVVGGEVLSPRMDGFVHGLIDLSSDTQSTS